MRLQWQEVKRTTSLASIEHGVPEASQDAWTYYLSCLDEARARLLSSVWATGPTERAQAQYCIQMLAAFGFNIYCAPRQAYPNFYLQTIFLPFEYGFGLPCPDFHYRWTFLDGARDYRIHGRLGKSRWIEFQAQRGFWGDENQSRLGNWDFDDFEVGADGSFEIIASPRKQEGQLDRTRPGLRQHHADGARCAVRLEQRRTDGGAYRARRLRNRPGPLRMAKKTCRAGCVPPGGW